MDLTSGTRGLEQSRHHRNAGKSTYAPVASSTSSEVEAIKEQGQLKKEIAAVLKGKVFPGKMEEVVEGLRSVVNIWIQCVRAETITIVNTENEDKDNRPATIGQIKKLF